MKMSKIQIQEKNDTLGEKNLEMFHLKILV